MKYSRENPSKEIEFHMGMIIAPISVVVGAWIGHVIAATRGAIIGGMILCFIGVAISSLAFLSVAKEAALKEMSFRQYIAFSSSIFLIGSLGFVIFRPDQFRGDFLGFAEIYSPLLISLGGILSLIRLSQSINPIHDFDNQKVGDKILGALIGIFWLISVILVFLWHTNIYQLSWG